MPRFNGIFLYLAAVAAVLAAYVLLPVSKDALLRDLGAIAPWTEANPIASSLAFFLASAALTYLAFPSMPLVYIAAGYSMHGLWGGLLVLLGGALGGLAAFLLYRKHIPRRLREPAQRSEINIWLALLGLRLSPIVPTPLVTFFAAAFRASPAQFLTTTLIGGAPLVLFYGFVGQQGHNYQYGAPIQWWALPGYLALIAISTGLSALGPWRSFVDMIRTLKSETGSTVAASCAPIPQGDIRAV